MENNNMHKTNYITDWVNHDATKRAAESWKGSEWIVSAIMDVPDLGMFFVQRTKPITPRKFKQHNHG